MPTPRARRGFTLLEIIVSMTLMLAVIGLSTKMFRLQSATVSTQNGRLDAQQNSRFAISSLERELRVAGAGVADAQPMLVMANRLGLTFNVNLAALDTGDLSAVYINPDADSNAVNLLHTTDQITLPGTTTQYPDTDYTLNAGVPSHAETISYWLEADTTGGRSDEYTLYRRVNARPQRLIARGLIYNASTDTIFHYYKVDTIGQLVEIPTSSLPLIHTAPIHGSQADTGASALTDSIRQVRVTFTSIFRDPRTPTDSVLRSQTLTIHLMNAGLLHHTTCGEPPIEPTNVAAVVVPADALNPQTYVSITWTPSIDDGAGEQDVERYAVYRRLSTVTDFGEPFASVPGASSTYAFRDTNVLPGQTWIYGVAAQDCSATNSSSTIAAAPSVVIP